MFNAHSDCIPRWRYEELKTEYRELWERYHALKLAGAVQPPASREPREPKAPPRDPLVDKLTEDLSGVMGDSAAARAEAERIRREAFG